MPAKIYYTVNTNTHNFPVSWIDELGVNHTDEIETLVNGHVDYSPGDVDQEFRLLHPGAVYLNKKDFEARQRQVATDRMKLNAWKEWAV